AIARVLGLPEDRVRVRTPEVGGGFGVKGHAYPEDVLVPAVARALGRPVKWTETRSEHFLTAAGDRDQAHHARMAVRRDGTIVALETRFTRDHGAYPTLGEVITLNTINHLPGPYRVPAYRATRGHVVTHKTFIAAYRGTGLGPFEGADVRVDPGGTIFVRVGVAAQGQAHETTLAQICAERLGVPLAHVVVLGGDTELVGFGMGTIASRVAAVAGPAVAKSADEVARRAQLVAAEQLECAPEDVVLAEGRASVRGVPARGLPLGAVARAAVRSRALASRGSPGLSACGFFYPDSVTWAFG